MLKVVRIRKTKTVGVKLSEKDREIIEKIAKKYDITMSDVVRIAIREYIERNGGDRLI
jgi:antitoxin component of RelBE/YafQ-DinJ toxin-antitoxin module